MWLSHFLGRAVVVLPSPPVPMVFLMRNYVRVARISLFGWDWGGGRIAMRARNVPGGLVADYSGRA